MTAAEFVRFTHVPCGQLIESAEDAHDHRALNRLGPNTCRKLHGKTAGGRPRRTKIAPGQLRRKDRGDRRKWRTSEPIDRRAWRRAVATVVVGADDKGHPRIAKAWAVEYAPWAVRS